MTKVTSVKMPKQAAYYRKQSGLTLIEVSVAIAILAMIFVLTQESIGTATKAFEVNSRASERVEQIDRTWFFIKQDLRNILSYDMKPLYGQDYPPFIIQYGQDVWMWVLRGNKLNPMGLPRSEMTRVAYKFEEDTISRYSWYDPAVVDFEMAQEQKLLEGVKSVDVRALPVDAKSEDNGWTQDFGQKDTIPMAVEVTLTLEDRGEMTRIFMLPYAK